jgi:hypothetical protein
MEIFSRYARYITPSQPRGSAMYLLHIVGLRADGLAASGAWAGGIRSAAGIRHIIDILITGLAIGGGTKPLHDLISNLQAAKVSKKDPSQTQCVLVITTVRAAERGGGCSNPAGAGCALKEYGNPEPGLRGVLPQVQG